MQVRIGPRAAPRQRELSAPPEVSDANVRVSAHTASAIAATLGLAGICWVVSIRQMHGMDMGTATELGSFGSFIGVWVAMMAAMMLPGAAPAVRRRARAAAAIDAARSAVVRFVGSYLAVWALVGVVVYVLYRPHGTLAAGVIAIAAGLYELTPAKRHYGRRCRDGVGSGWEYGICCVGSSVGLMELLVALGVMSVTWMTMIAVVLLAQKLLPATAAVDVPLALAIVGLGVLIVVAPSAVPALTPPM